MYLWAFPYDHCLPEQLFDIVMPIKCQAIGIHFQPIDSIECGNESNKHIQSQHNASICVCFYYSTLFFVVRSSFAKATDAQNIRLWFVWFQLMIVCMSRICRFLPCILWFIVGRIDIVFSWAYDVYVVHSFMCTMYVSNTDKCKTNLNSNCRIANRSRLSIMRDCAFAYWVYYILCAHATPCHAWTDNWNVVALETWNTKQKQHKWNEFE